MIDPFANFTCPCERFMESGSYKKALQCYEKVVERYPRSSIAWSGKGFAHFYLAEFKKAHDCFMRAISIQEGKEEGIDQNLWVCAGLALIALREHAKALPYFDNALEISKAGWEGARAFYAKAFIYASRGRLDTAIKYLQKAYEALKKKGLHEWGEWILSQIKELEKGNNVLDAAPDCYFISGVDSPKIFEPFREKISAKNIKPLSSEEEKGIEEEFDELDEEANSGGVTISIDDEEVEGKDEEKPKGKPLTVSDEEKPKGKPLTVSPQTFIDLVNSLPYLKKYITFQKVKLDDLITLVKEFFDERAGIIAETEGKDQYGLDYAFKIYDKNYILCVTIVRNKHYGNISHLDFKIFSRDVEDLPKLLEELTIELSDYIEQQTSRKEVILESREQKQSAEAAIDEAIAELARLEVEKKRKRRGL